MRYEIGQTIFAVQFSIEKEKELRPIKMFRMPFLYDDAVPDQINLVRMAVSEHHKVSSEWDDIKQYDGFILKDKDGMLYDNQYPRAAYGQLSDTADRRFRVHAEEKDVEIRDKLMTGKMVYEYHLLTDVLGDMRMGVYDLEKAGLPDMIKKAELLNALLQKTIDQFNKEFPEYELTYSEDKLSFREFNPEYKIEYKQG